MGRHNQILGTEVPVWADRIRMIINQKANFSCHTISSCLIFSHKFLWTAFSISQALRSKQFHVMSDSLNSAKPSSGTSQIYFHRKELYGSIFLLLYSLASYVYWRVIILSFLSHFRLSPSLFPLFSVSGVPFSIFDYFQYFMLVTYCIEIV